MHPKIKAWVLAFRLKTLPLALSNTIVGSALAIHDKKFQWIIFLITAATTILLQILSNIANDYGDFVNKKDTKERIGPKRMVQTGNISVQEMRMGIFTIGLLTAICGAYLIWVGTQGLHLTNIIIFIILGIGAIIAALKYTIGKKPYGYMGFGDLFVFIFFGLVGVLGTYFLQTQQFRTENILPAISIGLLSVGVLNMNNMRDYYTDKETGKKTVVVFFGQKKAAIYHLGLISGSIISITTYSLIESSSIYQWLFVLSIPLLATNVFKTFNYKQPIELMPELGKLSIATLVFSILFLAGELMFQYI